MNLVESFKENISKKDRLQAKYMHDNIPNLTDEELLSLENLLKYFISKGETIDSMVDAYLNIIKVYNTTHREFLKTGRYRYSKFSEVCDKVYYNKEFMHQYMLMQNISQYLFITHLEITRYFKNMLIKNNFSSGRYLEIGQGYGNYFMLALKYTNMDFYEGIDLSKTSVEGSIEYIKANISTSKPYEIKLQDFYHYDSKDKIKLVVSTEVLEHVEEPQLFLEKVRDILSNDGLAFITTAINAPALDHIYLFNNKEEIFEMVDKVDLKIEDYICLTSNKKSLAHAEQNKEPIVIGLLLRRK